MGLFWHGPDGVATFTPTGGSASDVTGRAHAFEDPREAPFVDTAVFASGNFESGEAGIPSSTIIITCRGHDSDDWIGIGTAGVIVLQSKSGTTYKKATGSAVLLREPFRRTRGNAVDDIALAFRAIGSWTTSLVAP